MALGGSPGVSPTSPGIGPATQVSLLKGMVYAELEPGDKTKCWSSCLAIEELSHRNEL